MEYGQILVWWVTYQALTLLGMPIASLLLARFADRGAAFGLPVALVVLTMFTYWVGHVSFGTVTLFAALAVLAALSVLAVRRGGTIRWRSYAEVTAVFTVAFAFLLAIRAVDPAVSAGGGEKFLDYGLLKSLLRATHLPPEDMWFAGEAVQYYYGGHLMASLLTRLTGTEARFAYNLALAGFYAMLVTAAYGLAGAIASNRGISRPLAGGFGAFLVGIASNLYTPLYLLLWALPVSIAEPIVNRLVPKLSDWIDAEQLLAPPSEFGYWDGTRVIPDTINEFPLFAFLNGDLHAHMMSTPFLLLTAALLYEYFRTPPENLARRRGLVGAAIPVAGLLAVVNTWSFPSAGGLVLLALLFGPGHPLTLLPRSVAERFGATPGTTELGDGWAEQEGTRALAAVVLAAGVGLFGALSVAPFFLGTASGRAVGLLPSRSPMGPLLVVHGAFLLVFALYLLPRALSVVRRERTDRLLVLGGLLLTLGWLEQLAAVVVVGPLLAVAWVLLRSDRDVGYEAVLFVAGAGLVLLVEFLYVEENAAPERMNTVFKVYMQVWVVWAVATAVALAGLVSETASDAVPDTGTLSRGFAVALSAALVVSLSAYGGLALSGHFTNSPNVSDPTLDATRFAEVYHPDEAAAIEWMDANIEGQPNVVSAPGIDIYQWANAEASLTGIPTLAGWIHEKGYREGERYDERVTDVRTIYTGSRDERRQLLREYDVEYIYEGPREREAYGTTDFSRESGVSVAYRNEGVVVYRVDQSAF